MAKFRKNSAQRMWNLWRNDQKIACWFYWWGSFAIYWEKIPGKWICKVLPILAISLLQILKICIYVIASLVARWSLTIEKSVSFLSAHEKLEYFELLWKIEHFYTIFRNKKSGVVNKNCKNFSFLNSNFDARWSPFIEKWLFFLYAVRYKSNFYLFL